MRLVAKSGQATCRVRIDNLPVWLQHLKGLLPNFHLILGKFKQNNSLLFPPI